MHRKTNPLADILSFLLLVAALTWLAFFTTERLDYNWQWYRVPRYIYSIRDGAFVPGPLLEGLKVTFRITLYSLFLSFGIGLTTAIFRLSNSYVARLVARVYLEVIRNSPLLIQLFFMYFVVSPVIGMDRFTTAVLALSLFEGAYASEVFRAGIISIRKGQWEAAYSLGLSTWHTYTRIILPQAIRRIVPPLTSIAVSLVKDSALVSTIAIYDLTMQGQVVVSETFLTFEIWFTVAAIYLLVTVSLSLTISRLDKRMKLQP